MGMTSLSNLLFFRLSIPRERERKKKWTDGLAKSGTYLSRQKQTLLFSLRLETDGGALEAQHPSALNRNLGEAEKLKHSHL